jgi:hypothetical protein
MTIYSTTYLPISEISSKVLLETRAVFFCQQQLFEGRQSFRVQVHTNTPQIHVFKLERTNNDGASGLLDVYCKTSKVRKNERA